MPSGYPGTAKLVCPDCRGPKSGTAFARCKPCADVAKRSPGKCSISGCQMDAKTNGMCKRHDEHVRRSTLEFLACSLEGCNKDSRHGSLGMCGMHYARQKRRGAPGDESLSRRPNGVGGTRQELRRTYENARRARKNGSFVERVDLATLWERDGGICHICHEHAERWNWHMDHIVPISRGGEHSYANTAVAHPGCNLRKGNR